MGLLDRAQDFLEERIGFAVRPAQHVARLEESAQNLQWFRAEASELAYHALNYIGGAPQDLLPERRARLAQRSRIAFIQDPLAGAEAMNLANFAFGRGVGRPKANDKAVQQAIDRAWTDANNVEMLTGFSAQRKSSNSLLTQGELFDLLYARGGRVRVAKLDPDKVTDVVTDPEHGLRPILYLSYRQVRKWNAESDTYEVQSTEEGYAKKTYYPHWRNFEDAEAERKLPGGNDLEPLPDIPEEKRDPGGAVVYHTAINQVDGQLRGNPPWARTLRFYSAMNQFTEARVTMAQAAATFIAKRVMQGASQREIVKSATNVLSQTGELGTASFGDPDDLGGGAPFGASPLGQGGPLPPPPGSWFVENESEKLESLSLNSGASAAAADGQIIRAPLAAAGGFGQHYLGDASNANLATATSLELPTLMNVQAWQEIFEQRFRWFTDRAIEAAVKAGLLGGAYGDEQEEDPSDPRELAELVLQEADDIETMERRTGKDLGYSFEMPYPGRRNLPDVTSLFTQTLSVGNGILVENEPFMETVLDFLFTHGLQIENAPGRVEEVIERFKQQVEERKAEAEAIAAQAAADQPDGPGSSAQNPATPAPNKKPGDEPAGATPRKDEMAELDIPDDLRARVGSYITTVGEDFDDIVGAPAQIAVATISPNGSEPA